MIKLNDMKLTGQTKIDFENWYDNLTLKWYSDIKGLVSQINAFNSLPDSMKWGVYVDFFGEVANLHLIEYPMFIRVGKKSSFRYSWMIEGYTDKTQIIDETESGYLTPLEVRIAAIEAANKIYNQLKE